MYIVRHPHGRCLGIVSCISRIGGAVRKLRQPSSGNVHCADGGLWWLPWFGSDEPRDEHLQSDRHDHVDRYGN